MVSAIHNVHDIVNAKRLLLHLEIPIPGRHFQFGAASNETLDSLCKLLRRFALAPCLRWQKEDFAHDCP